MSIYRIVSSDDHVFEPPDLWTARVESKYRDRVPHIVRMEDSGDWWVFDGITGHGAGSGSQVGRRFHEPEKLTRTDTFENVRPGGYLPDERIKDMDVDGVDVSIVYPSVGLLLYRLPDSELLTALFSAYNDWIADYCNPFPKRLKGIGMVNVDDVTVGIRELERCSKMGLVGVMISVYPPENNSYDSPAYESLWTAAEDLSLPLSLHTGTNRPIAGHTVDTLQSMKPSFICNVDQWVRLSLADMLFSGVFERHPGLQVGSIEMETGWVPHFLDRLDYTYSQRPQGDSWHRFDGDLLPSDYFHKNVFVGFQEDALGIRDRHIIGVDNLLWGSDYPHFESTFPRSRQILEEILVGCTEEEKAKICGGNADRIYHLD